MAIPVGDEDSSCGSNSKTRLNRLLESDTADSKWINSEMIIKVLKGRYSHPGTQKELCEHLSWLQALLKCRYLCIISTFLTFGVPSVNACPQPGVTLSKGVLIPVIHNCNVAVDLSGRGIEDIHFEVNYTQLQELNVSHNVIENIHSKVLHKTPFLVMLDVTCNKLTTVWENSFYGTHIVRLYMSHNDIQVVYQGAFNGLENTLKFLNLSFNSIAHVDKGIFDKLKAVTVLDISYNGLSVIDQDAFKGMDHLLRLFMQGNKLKAVSGWLPSVSHLVLSNNSITTTEGIPHDASICVQLRYNPLTCTPKNKEFIAWCSQVKYCYCPNQEAICDGIENSDKRAEPEVEHPSTTVASGGRSLHACGILIAPMLFATK